MKWIWFEKYARRGFSVEPTILSKLESSVPAPMTRFWLGSESTTYILVVPYVYPTNFGNASSKQTELCYWLMEILKN